MNHRVIGDRAFEFTQKSCMGVEKDKCVQERPRSLSKSLLCTNTIDILGYFGHFNLGFQVTISSAHDRLG